jgi:CDP-diacylglycerol--glycerol-3-phosphate 3-phosphatidyltransferase
VNLGRFTTLPNFLSILRVVLVPFLGAALRHPDPVAARPLVLALLVAAFVTDWFDGRIARWTRQESGWGRLLDPIADKIFVLGVAAFLVAHRGFPLWLLAVLAARDGAILLFATLFMRRAAIVPASDSIGRVAMCVFSVALLAFAVPVGALQAPLVWASLAFVVLSSASYIARYLIAGRRVAAGPGVPGR